LALLASLVVAWLVPPGTLLDVDAITRFVLASAIAFMPILLANLVFAQRFKATGSSSIAFGANLLGAMVGGVLEYASLIVGYRALTIVVASLYAISYLLSLKRRQTGRGHSIVSVGSVSRSGLA
jgi:hypothetical protein